MLIPKRFKLEKAASAKPRPETGMHLDCIHLRNGHLLASNGNGAAQIPIAAHLQDTMPRIEVGEDLPECRIPLQAMREATKGTTGVGTLRLGESSTEAQSASGKPWLRVENPEPAGQVPNFDEAFARSEQEAPPTHHYVEICFDAQLLAGIAAGIGADEAVRLKVLVNNKTGIADAEGAAHGVIDVRPIRESDGGRGVIMIHVIQ